MNADYDNSSFWGNIDKQLNVITNPDNIVVWDGKKVTKVFRKTDAFAWIKNIFYNLFGSSSGEEARKLIYSAKVDDVCKLSNEAIQSAFDIINDNEIKDEDKLGRLQDYFLALNIGIIKQKEKLQAAYARIPNFTADTTKLDTLIHEINSLILHLNKAEELFKKENSDPQEVLSILVRKANFNNAKIGEFRLKLNNLYYDLTAKNIDELLISKRDGKIDEEKWLKCTQYALEKNIIPLREACLERIPYLNKECKSLNDIFRLTRILDLLDKHKLGLHRWPYPKVQCEDGPKNFSQFLKTPDKYSPLEGLQWIIIYASHPVKAEKFITSENVENLLKFAEFHKIPALKEHCDKFIASSLNADKAEYIKNMELALKYHLSNTMCEGIDLLPEVKLDLESNKSINFLYDIARWIYQRDLLYVKPQFEKGGLYPPITLITHDRQDIVLVNFAAFLYFSDLFKEMVKTFNYKTGEAIQLPWNVDKGLLKTLEKWMINKLIGNDSSAKSLITNENIRDLAMIADFYQINELQKDCVESYKETHKLYSGILLDRNKLSTYLQKISDSIVSNRNECPALHDAGIDLLRSSVTVRKDSHELKTYLECLLDSAKQDETRYMQKIIVEQLINMIPDKIHNEFDFFNSSFYRSEEKYGFMSGNFKRNNPISSDILRFNTVFNVGDERYFQEKNFFSNTLIRTTSILERKYLLKELIDLIRRDTSTHRRDFLVNELCRYIKNGY